MLLTAVHGLAGTRATLSADTFAPGETVEVTLNGLPGNAQDWVSLAKADQSDNQYLSFQYLRGATDTSWSFAAPAPGKYELRVYHDWPSGGYEPVLRLPLEVVAPDQAATAGLTATPTLDLSATTFTAGEPIEVAVRDLPGNRQDWIAIARAGSADDQYVDYDYTDGVTEGSWTYRPREPGDYEIRVYLDWPDGGYRPVLRRSITVVAAAAPPEPAVPASTIGTGQRRGTPMAQPDLDSLPRVSAAEIAQEAQTVVEQCEKRGMISTLNDCDCIGRAFITLREQEPYRGIDPLQIANRIPDSACADGDSIRRYYLLRCGELYMHRIGAGLDAFCACYADEIAERYLADPASNYSALAGIGAAAITACDARGLPSPLNDDREYSGPLPAEPSSEPDARGFLPLPEGLCRVADAVSSGPQMDRFRACQKAKYPHYLVNPGYEVNVDYQLCVWTRLRDVRDPARGGQIERGCEQEYGKPQRYVGG
jgi:hypothetical protein